MKQQYSTNIGQWPGRYLVVALAVLLAGVLGVSIPSGQAKITSRICSNCHTMHNSQGSQSMAKEWVVGDWQMSPDSSPNPALLLYAGCVACHTNTTDGSTTGAYGAPIVFNTKQAPSDMLAGGNFYWIFDSGEDGNRKGHNVVTLWKPDTLTSPPGGLTLPGGNLNCAGNAGCHGDPAQTDELTAIKGSHHADDAYIDGTSVAKSYRFLGISSSPFKGVIGLEDSDWERTCSSSDHNEYKGAPGTTDGISSLCARCHGEFRTAVGDSAPYLHHPTDVVMPNSGEYANYNFGHGYNIVAPVARQNPLNFTSPAQHQSFTPDSDCVMCLSCHRAHGSPYWKILRWDYPTTYQTPEGGCATCHTYMD